MQAHDETTGRGCLRPQAASGSSGVYCIQTFGGEEGGLDVHEKP